MNYEFGVQSNRIIIDGTVSFNEIQYKNEKQLESAVYENKYSVFGENIIYVDSKQVITSDANISRIPDGLFLSLNSFEQAKLWLVEYELSKHDLENHILPQILGFMSAIKNESTKRKIKELLFKVVRGDPILIKKVRRILPQDDEVYHFLEIVLERKPGIVIVIEKKTPELEEIVDQLHITTNSTTQILEFIAYENNTGKRLYLSDILRGTPEKVVSQTHVSDTWDKRFAIASPEVQNMVNQIITTVRNEVQCIRSSWFKWFGFYLAEPRQRKNLFAVIIIGKNTASLCFRVNPDTFDDNTVRTVRGFFFPSGTERRIHLESGNMKQALHYVKSSFNVTKALNRG